jgi:MOSC domain-containing protein YiiM
MEAAEILHVYICLVHRFPMKEVAAAEAVENKGLRGCIHGRPGSRRQMSLMDIETLDRLRIPPGSVKENLTIRGLDFQRVRAGQRFAVGDAVLEITIPCDPCARMDEIRNGLQRELRGQRGWLRRVVQGGTIRRGDRIELKTTAQAVAN